MSTIRFIRRNVTRSLVLPIALIALAGCEQQPPTAPEMGSVSASTAQPSFAKGGPAKTFSARAYGRVTAGVWGIFDAKLEPGSQNVVGVRQVSSQLYCLVLAPEAFPDPKVVFGIVSRTEPGIQGEVAWIGSHPVCSSGEVAIVSRAPDPGDKQSPSFTFIIM